MKRILWIAISALGLMTPLNAPAAPRASAVQPGAQIRTPVGTCTLNFVFQEASGTKYIGTAGHCGGVGKVARTPSPDRELGTIVFSENKAAPGIDFALIRIDPARYSEVQPAVRMFGGPTGTIDPKNANPGDLVYITGYGLGFGQTEATRHRAGFLVRSSEHEYVANMVAVMGDSGGPVLHGRTGQALGVVSRFNVPASTDIGPSMARILERLQESGYPSIQLVTAPSEF
jgi:hypothetical protein